jgi:hypothetical protein
VTAPVEKLRVKNRSQILTLGFDIPVLIYQQYQTKPSQRNQRYLALGVPTQSSSIYGSILPYIRITRDRESA